MGVPGNSIMVLRPYKWNGVWVFDDPSVGLVREAFVSGADTIIDMATEKAGVYDPENGFLMTFSETPFPGFQVHLRWDRESKMGFGNWYRWNEVGMEGWLCPALFKYFPKAPKDIYVKVESRK